MHTAGSQIFYSRNIFLYWFFVVVVVVWFFIQPCQSKWNNIEVLAWCNEDYNFVLKLALPFNKSPTFPLIYISSSSMYSLTICYWVLGGFIHLREIHRQTSICCFTYLCIHWLILVGALTRGSRCNRRLSNAQLSYPARA